MLSLLLMAEIIFRDEDARLVHSVLSGNQSAFEEIVRKYEKMVYNTAYQFTMFAATVNFQAGCTA